jgi:outer membrane lipoprotein-sorting protein
MPSLIAVVAGCGGFLLATALQAAPPTADEIIARSIEARGGAAKLEAIKMLERSGRLLIPGYNIELTVRELKTRAGEYRQDVTLQGLTQIEAYDGHQAWTVQPFQGRKDPSLMSADEAKALKLAADLDLPLVDYRRKGHTVEYLGLEDIDGTPAHKLRVRLQWGDEATYWIDPDTWMVIRELDRQSIRGAEQLTETDYGEYERVAGVYFPMTEQQGPKDSDASQKQKVVYDKARANVAVAPSEFAFPAQPRANQPVQP